MPRNESVLYTTISEGLALMRYGAVPLLRCSKCWDLDGWLVDAGAGNALCNAYSVQDLLSMRTARKMEVEITGNARYDMAIVMSAVLSEMRRIRPMPFRIWEYDHYAAGSRGDRIQYVAAQSGEIRCFRPSGRTYEETEPPRGMELERSTGYDDAHGVPVFQNDAASMDGGLFRVTWCNGGWQMLPMDGDESAGVDLASSRTRTSVVSSSRTDPAMLRRIASLMASQEGPR